MSKNITIKEGGAAKQLTVDKLKTNLVSGGTCLWVPEDETNLTTKTITANGTYKASDDGYYGYSEVTVSGIGTATGTDEDGDEAVVTTGEGGELEQNKVPSSIVVDEPPVVVGGVYPDGQTIDKEGMVVKAYLKEGGLYDTEDYPGGVIPIEELTLNPTAAHYDETSHEGESTYDGFGEGPWPLPIKYVIGELKAVHITGDDYHLFTYNNGYIALLMDGTFRGDTLFCSTSPGTATIGWQFDASGVPYQTKTVDVLTPYTYDEKTVYYNGSGYSGYNFQAPPGANQIASGNQLDKAKAAWTIIYGIKSVTPNTQTITVSWPRPYDQKILETTFEINVAPPSGGHGED